MKKENTPTAYIDSLNTPFLIWKVVKALSTSIFFIIIIVAIVSFYYHRQELYDSKNKEIESNRKDHVDMWVKYCTAPDAPITRQQFPRCRESYDFLHTDFSGQIYDFVQEETVGHFIPFYHWCGSSTRCGEAMIDLMKSVHNNFQLFLIAVIVFWGSISYCFIAGPCRHCWQAKEAIAIWNEKRNAALPVYLKKEE